MTKNDKKHQISQLVGSVSQDQYNLQFKPNNFNKLQSKKKKKRFEFKLSLTCSYRIKRLKNNSSQKKKINIS